MWRKEFAVAEKLSHLHAPGCSKWAWFGKHLVERMLSEGVKACYALPCSTLIQKILSPEPGDAVRDGGKSLSSA